MYFPCCCLPFLAAAYPIDGAGDMFLGCLYVSAYMCVSILIRGILQQFAVNF